MTDRLRVGVLTFHRCINNGSFWQTAATVAGLRGRGVDVVVLDHDSRRVNIAEWRCALRPTLPTPVPPGDRKAYRVKLAKFCEAFDTLPLSARFDLDRADECPDVDIVIVGSDEVWNLSHPWYGGAPLFYGEGIHHHRLISYAASFGNYDASRRLPERWRDDLREFDSISVRDDNSRLLVHDALGIDPEVVLDPCLQFPVARNTVSEDLPDRPFVAVYGHNFTQPFIAQLTDWARRRGAHLVSIGYRNDWVDEQWLDAGPFDYAAAISHADAVVTNFFHGCVFALLDDVPFICESTPYRSTKVNDLLTRLGATEHLATSATSPEAFAARLEQPIAAAIGVRLDELRRRSDDYLDSALGL